MSHLLAMAVGPVQEFIAAARRTRDLWFGSYLLSEISKAVAKSVKDQGGELIFPHPDTDLTPGNDKVNVANVILAELSTGEPKQIAEKTKKAAKDRWIDFVNDAWSRASGVIRTDKDFWNEQKNDVIEFYAAWVTYDRSKCGKARKEVMRLLAGRKNLRDFDPAKGSDVGIPKSSLDGQRESVLKDPIHWPKKFRARLRIREGEQLDVVGLVKRVAEGDRPYPSVSRVAADPWVRGNKGNETFSELKNACEELPKPVLHRLDAETFPQFQDFPYEGTAVYVSRHHEWEEEIDDEDRLSIVDIHDALAKLSDPNPYLAVLVADGDRMGAAISALDSAYEHRAFSQTLAGFATEARKIVNDHNGVLVYAGGDDVLAFLPVDKCLACARELRDKFIALLDEAMTSIFEKEPEKKPLTPTLSVGIAIGYFMENLEDLLQYGRDAEKAAKKVEGKDALAVHLHKRGGAPIKIASRWENNPEVRLHDFAELMNNGTIPTKLPYELRAMAKLYEPWKENVAEAIKQDLARVIAKKASKGVDTVKAAMEPYIKGLDSKKLLALAEELLVARQIASSLRQAAGRAGATEEVIS